MVNRALVKERLEDLKKFMYVELNLLKAQINENQFFHNKIEEKSVYEKKFKLLKHQKACKILRSKKRRCYSPRQVGIINNTINYLRS